MEKKEYIKTYHRQYYATHRDMKTICQYCGKNSNSAGLSRHQQGYKCKFFQLSKTKPDEPEHIIKEKRLQEFYRFWNSQ